MKFIHVHLNLLESAWMLRYRRGAPGIRIGMTKLAW